MVVSRAFFHSLIVKDKSNGADPVRLLHSVCTISFPFEGVALAIVYMILSCLRSMMLVGEDMLDRDWEISLVIRVIKL